MRKLFSYILAGITLLSASACVHEQPAVFDPTKGTAPVLLSYNVSEDGVTAEFTPGSIDMGFNKNVPPYHSFAIVELDGAKANKVIPSNVSDGKISITKTTLSKTLMSMGKAEGSTAALKMTVRLSLQDPTKDSGINGFIDSKDVLTIDSWVVEVPVPQGNPWKDYTEKSTWSVIGSIASTGNSWGNDEPMFTDGSKHVAKGLKLATSDQFKIRNNGSWDDNRGATGDTEPFIVSLGEPLTANPGGKNLAVPADGVYDLLYDPAAETITVTEAFMTYPGFDSVSEWSVIGAIASFDMSWNKDIEMSTDGTWHVAEGVELKASDQFKFRKNQDWGDNFGATGDTEPFIVALDTEYEANPGGKNLAVPEDGVYDLLVNPEAKLYKVVATLGGSCHLVGEGGPDTPEPPAFEGWGVTGSIAGAGINWDGDIDMTASGSFWVARDVKLAPSDQFKFRKAHDWGENIGATGDVEPFVVELGAKTAGAAGGKNLAVPAEGTYDLYLNPEELSFYVMTAGEVPAELASWGVVGTINSWGGSADLAMVEENGMLVRKNVALNTGDQFKIRYMSSWDVNRGAPGDVEPFIMGTDPIQAVPNGKNLGVAADGNYDVWYDALNEILFVVPAGTALSYWGVVGNITGWGGDRADYIMYKSGDFYAVKGIELNEESQFKIRYNSDWAVNRGAPGDVEPFKVDAGSVVEATQNGKNLGVNVAGKYDIYYNAAEEKLYVMGEGNDPSGAVTPEPPTPEKPTAWSIVGTIESSSWGKDFDLTNTEGDIWKYEGLTVTDTDEFKIRANHDWGTSVGGAEENEDSGIDPVGNPYKVFRPTIGTAFAAGGLNIRIAVAGTYNVTFDYAAKTILIEAGAPAAGAKVINTADELIAYLENPTEDAELGADINISGKQMLPAPEMTGNFDGKDHKITVSLGFPLFPLVRGDIKNLTIDGSFNATCGADKTVLAPIGKSYGTIQNVINRATVTLSGPAGQGGAETKNGAIAAGVVGEGYGPVKYCKNFGEISALASGKDTWAIFVGGIAGVVGDVVEGCANHGEVKLVAGSPLGRTKGLTEVSMKYDPVASVAGIVVYAVSDATHAVTVMDCENNANVSFTYDNLHDKSAAVSRSPVAGIVANSGGDITNCHNSGNILAKMVASDRSKAYADINIILHAAGVQGSDYFVKKIKSTVDQNETTLYNCSNTGDIIADSDMTKSNNTIGGVSAWPCAESASVTEIKGCTNSGNLYVSGLLKIRAGGIAGGTNNIDGCKNTGSIYVESADKSSVFGLINGFHTQTHSLKNCEANGTIEAKKEVSGLGGICGGVGNAENTICEGCKVFAHLYGGGTVQCGLIVGHLNGNTKNITIGTPDSPVTVNGSVDGVTANADNYMSLIQKATNYTEGVHTFNAVFGN
ncbi:MAG: hypothetical protein K6E37_01240 [Bacteroidales bacterium]|nr:hypothetical protein [Bacteroidales bacterium]